MKNAGWDKSWINAKGRDLNKIISGEDFDPNRCPKCGEEKMEYRSVGKVWTLKCVGCGSIRDAGFNCRGAIKQTDG